MRTDNEVTCLVCKQELTFRDQGVDDYTYYHSMIIHDNILEFDQPTFELADKQLALIEGSYSKHFCANCGNRLQKKRSPYLEKGPIKCKDCNTAHYCSKNVRPNM